MSNLHISVYKGEGDNALSISISGDIAAALTAPTAAAPPAQFGGGLLIERAPVILNPADLPRRFLDASGNMVEGGSSHHVITHFDTAGLMFDIRAPRNVSSTAEAWQLARECDLLGRKGEWVVGKDWENNLIIDRDFREPAVNPQSFPNMPNQGLIYCDRGLKGSPGRVWFVDLHNGNVLCTNDDYNGLVVPCLRVPPRQ
ncbi:hypothetical protein C3942_00670 [Solimonas fluminis]|uniref:DUF1566 domain-containing protein n=1 Tax=Solimonas fluminis TaxID=2086571 RepID=A0A2S5TKF5_9GAMM|nr:hypothetical protein [Solimonas fluminis]PPE75441.1 hypothetical protein C3942_00670 [Solimonas fluminis]